MRTDMDTDVQTRRDVVEALQWDAGVDADDIAVDVHAGTVTLSGVVHTAAEKACAERAARRIRGVKRLHVEIVTRCPVSSRRTDAEIGRAASNVLKWTIGAPASAVKIDVDQGWVTLTGRIELDFQRRIATSAIAPLSGVIGVSDRIARLPSATATGLESIVDRTARQRRPRGETQAPVRRQSLWHPELMAE